METIYRCPGDDPNGCAWTGCLANTGFPGIHRRAEESLPREWKNDERGSARTSTSNCVAVGFWAMKNSERNFCWLRRLDHQMKMVPHQAIGMDLPFGLATGFSEGGKEALAIIDIAKDVLTAIPAIHDMINRS